MAYPQVFVAAMDDIDLKFWITALGIPLLAVIINVVVRAVRGMSQSALPDLILCFVVFDAIVVIQNEDFAKFIRVFRREDTIAFFVLLLIVDLVLWLLTVIEIEERMIANFAAATTISRVKAMGFMLISLIVATLVVFGSVFPFTHAPVPH